VNFVFGALVAGKQGLQTAAHPSQPPNAQVFLSTGGLGVLHTGRITIPAWMQTHGISINSDQNHIILGVDIAGGVHTGDQTPQLAHNKQAKSLMNRRHANGLIVLTLTFSSFRESISLN
jgi:hypothetical protein